MITIHILRKFSRGSLKAENEKNLAENEVGRLVPDLYEAKASVSTLVIMHFGSSQQRHKIKINCWSRNLLNFDFLGKGMGLVSPPHLMYDVSRKMFPVFPGWGRTFYSLLVTFSSLLVTTYSLLVTFYSLLVTFYSLLVTTYSLLVAFYFLLVTFYSLVVDFYLLLVTFYLLLVTLYFTFPSSPLSRYSLFFTRYFCSLISTICLLNFGNWVMLRTLI